MKQVYTILAKQIRNYITKYEIRMKYSAQSQIVHGQR